VFDLDDAGELTYRFEGNEVPDELARAGPALPVNSCPVAALRELS